MAQVELRHPQGTYQVSCVHLITKCDLFKNNPGLTLSPYQVQSEVSLADFQDFISALEAKSIRINDTNLPGLRQLSEEFGFQVFLMKISNRQRFPGLSEGQRMKYQSQISSLEKQVGQHEHQLAALQSMLLVAVQHFETDLERLGSELEAVRDMKNSETATPDRSRRRKSPPAAVSPIVAAIVSPSVAAAVSPSVAAAVSPSVAATISRSVAATVSRSVAAAVSPSVTAAVSPSVAAIVSPSVAAAVPPIASVKSQPPAVPSVPSQLARLDSLILSEYPPLFEEFHMKRWTVLWRGSRDGFTAEEFHRRCDGHANTLTLIFGTDGNVFGGFTPVEWKSSFEYQGDDSLQSFLFTLRNPHGVPARKFALKEEQRSGQSIAIVVVVQDLAATLIFLLRITATQTVTVTLTLALAMGVTRRTRMTANLSTSSRARRSSQ
jgi:hypothetical protein